MWESDFKNNLPNKFGISTSLLLQKLHEAKCRKMSFYVLWKKQRK